VRYVGVLLYDASRVADVVRTPRESLLRAYLGMLLDPRADDTCAAAEQSGVPAAVLDAARRSPVYRFVKDWQLALPLHLEFRTLPTLFYVPPLSPVMAAGEGDRARIPVRYLAALFGTGDEEPVRRALDKQQALRAYRRALMGEGLPAARAALERAGCCTEEAEEIYRLTALATARERYVVPPGMREGSTESFQRRPR
jgi:nitrate reductase beta subunit